LIIDLLPNHRLYPLGPAWREAFAFLRDAGPELAAGKYPLRGDRMFAIVMDYLTQPAATGELETHRRYLDIQMLLLGREAVVCHFVPDLQILQPYDPARDVELYLVPVAARTRIILNPGHFLALFPNDAHMPCLCLKHTPEPVRKIVVKVAVELLAPSA